MKLVSFLYSQDLSNCKTAQFSFRYPLCFCTLKI